MCGIAGFLTDQSLSLETAQHDLHTMGQTLIHRGPDSGHFWIDREQGLGFGHRRLSINDLTIAGQQPMVSQDGRWVICYNGEVYSHKDLRSLLHKKGIILKGHSDTEIILETCAVLGPIEALSYFTGMFAFALWDRYEKTLYLFRDRIGIKPLYWTFQNQSLFFASELKALKAHPRIETSLDRSSLAGYLKKGYISAPQTIYRHIFKLLPGHFLTFQLGASPCTRSYWELKDAVKIGRQQAVFLSPDQAVEELQHLLRNTIQSNLTADVPIGAFLSGGIDSSLVAALMQEQSSQAIKTFTIGFREQNYNEAPYAQKIAEHLGTHHSELLVTPKQAQNVVPLLPILYDEPFADVSQIPTFLLSQFAKQHITVALSGDGGDESFGGYNRYQLGEKLWRLKNYPFIGTFGKVLSRLPFHRWTLIGQLLPQAYQKLRLSERAEKMAYLFQAQSQQEMYNLFTNQWLNVEDLLPDVMASDIGYWLHEDTLSFSDKMQYADSMEYLPDDVLVKVDRATMGVGLEARVPLLDHRIVQWAWRQNCHNHQGQSKWLLKQVLKKYLPDSLFERPKMGFSVPIGDWLRKELKSWANDLLSENSLNQTFNSGPILQAWKEHESGQGTHSQKLWNILMFQGWLHHNG